MASNSGDSARPVASVEREPLPFSFRLVGGSGKLSLRELRLFDRVLVDRLELEVPDLPLPLDLAEGAERFQNKRTRVSLAAFRMSQADLSAVVADADPALSERGIEELSLRAEDGHLSATGRVRQGEHSTEFAFRVVVHSSGGRLRAAIAHPFVFGFFPLPAPLVAHRAADAIFGAHASADLRLDSRGVGDFELDPLAGLLWNLLPTAGWRLPDSSRTRIIAAHVRRDVVELSYANKASPTGEITGAESPLFAQLELTRTGDDLLARGDLEGAFAAYREGPVEGEHADPLACERLLAVAAAMPGRHRDAESFARTTLARWPGFAPAHAALAAVAAADGAGERAAESLGALARSAAEAGNQEAAAGAALAGARLVKNTAPALATPLYELAVNHRSGLGEAVDALADRYADEQRWHELVRLLRARVSTTTDRERQARDQVRLARVLRDELSDAEAARDELESATQLAPRYVPAWEELAQTHRALDQPTLAVRALDTAADLLAASGDALGEARAQIQVAHIWRAAGDDARASSRYRRALRLAPEMPDAIEGAAHAADIEGHHQQAAELWQRLLQVGGADPQRRAHLLLHLGRSLASSGDAEAANGPLTQAAELEAGRASAEAWAELAAVEEQAGSLGGAAAALEHSIALLTDETSSSVDDHERAAELALRRATLVESTAPDAAAADYERAHRLAPESAFARDAARALYQAAAAAEDRDGRRRWLGALLDTAPPEIDEQRADLLLERIELALEDRDLAGASAALDDLLEQPELDTARRARALDLRALQYDLQGELRAAAGSLTVRAELLERDAPSDAAIEALLAASRAWLDAGLPERALPVARRADVLAGDVGEKADTGTAIDLRLSVYTVLGEAAWRRRAWEDVSRTCELRIAQETSGKRRASLGHRLGVALEALGQRDRAVEVLERATAEAEGSSDDLQACWKALASAYERRGEPMNAARAYEALADDDRIHAAPKTRADAWYRAGDLYRRQEDQAENAERCLESALAAVEDHLPALDALERLKSEHGDYERVAAILGRKIAATSRQPERQKALLARLAELQATRLGRRDVAIESYQRALELDPHFRPALVFLANDARERDDVDTAIAGFRRLASALPGDERLADRGDAIAVEHERVAATLVLAELLSNAGRPLEAIEPLLAAQRLGERDDRIVAALESAYRAAGRYVDAASVLGTRAAHARNPERALDFDLRRLALLEEHAHDPVETLAACRAALSRNPESPRLRARAVALARQIGDPEGLVDALLSAADSPETARLDGKTCADLLVEAADVELHRRNDNLAASELFHRALALEPDHPAALSGLSETGAVDAEPVDQSAVDELMSNARARVDAGDIDGALELLAGPDTPAATELLRLRAELYENKECWREAADDLTRLRRLAARAGDTATEEITTRRLAALTLEHLHDDAAAADLYHRLLELDGEDLAAAESLASIYGRRRERGRQRRALERALAIARRRDGSEQVSVLRELGGVARLSGDLPAAAAYLDELLEISGDDPGAARERAELAALAGDWLTCAELLERVAERYSRSGDDDDSARAGDLLIELASIYGDQLDDADRARATMFRAAESFSNPARRDATYRLIASRELRADNAEGVADALGRIASDRRTQADLLNMAKALQRAGRDRAALELLEQASAEETLGDQAAMLSFALHREVERKRGLAAALERGADDAPAASAEMRLREALQLYATALDDQEAEARVRAALDRLSRRANGDTEPPSDSESIAAGAFAPLESAAVRAAESGDIDGATALYREAAARRSLADDARGAAAVLAGALTIAPADRDLFSDLEAALRSIGDFTRLAAAYELHLGTLQGAVQAEAIRELARIYGQSLGDDARAEELRCVADELDAGLEPGPWSRNEALDGVLGAPVGAAAADAGDAAASHLDDDHASSGAGATDKDGGGRTTAYEQQLRIADSLELRGQLDAAIGHLQNAAAAAPDALEPLERLERLYRELDNWDAVAEVLGQQIELASSRPARARLWYQRARVYRDILHLEPETYRCLKQAYANDPTDRDMAYALRSVAMARGEWALAAELLYREIDGAASTMESAALHLELALIYDEKLLDANQARVNYEQALALDPDIPAAPAPLARLYELAGRHEDAARMGEVAARFARDDDTRSRLLGRAAACAERAGRKEEARRLFGLASMFAADAADSDAAAAAAARLGDDEEDPAGKSELLEVRLRETTDPDRRRQIRHELLDLAVAGTDAAAVRRHAGALLESDSTDLSAFLALKRAATAVGDWSVLAYLLRTRAGAVDDRVERAALFYELGQLCRDRLGDVGGAVSAFEQALAADPAHPAALESLADITYEKNDWQRARDLYQRLRPEVCSLPADVIAYRRGEICEILGDLDEAAAAYAEACRQCPTNLIALSGLARTAIQLGDLETALYASRGVCEVLPAEDVKAITAARLQVGELALKCDQPDIAARYLEAVLAEDPKSHSAMVQLAHVYPQIEEWEKAAEVIRRLADTAESPRERARIQFDLGEIFRYHLGDRERAGEAYLRAIDDDPSYAPTLHRLIDYFWRRGSQGEASEIALELHQLGGLMAPELDRETMARALIALGQQGRRDLAVKLGGSIGDVDALATGAAEAVDEERGPTDLEALAALLLEAIDASASIAPSQLADALDARTESDAGARLSELLRAG